MNNLQSIPFLFFFLCLTACNYPDSGYSLFPLPDGRETIQEWPKELKGDFYFKEIISDSMLSAMDFESKEEYYKYWNFDTLSNKIISISEPTNGLVEISLKFIIPKFTDELMDSVALRKYQIKQNYLFIQDLQNDSYGAFKFIETNDSLIYGNSLLYLLDYKNQELYGDIMQFMVGSSNDIYPTIKDKLIVKSKDDILYVNMQEENSILYSSIIFSKEQQNWKISYIDRATLEKFNEGEESVKIEKIIYSESVIKSKNENIEDIDYWEQLIMDYGLLIPCEIN